jgi:hypothetical protein
MLFGDCSQSPFLFAQNAFCADGLKEVLTPYQREVNMRSRALLATARSEVRSEWKEMTDSRVLDYKLMI